MCIDSEYVAHAVYIEMRSVNQMAKMLKFRDMRAKKSFTTDKYKMVKKSGRTFAVASTPSGSTAWRIAAKK